MSPTDIVKAIAMAALVLAAACGKRQTMKPATVVPPECEVLAAPADVPDTISVALFQTPDPATAPLALNAGEALVYHHLYETLITVDCSGEVRGALAASWKKSARGRRWTIELREGARFWNGKPVTAWDVEWWWRTAMHRSSLLDAAIDSIAVTGEQSLEVTFGRRHRSIPLILSSPELAVAAPSYDLSWPIGSGPFRLDERAPSSMRQGIIARPAFGGTAPVIRFVYASVRDARDLIDNEVDVLITADPDVIDYAENRRSLSTLALPWNRTYVLLSTTRATELRSGGKPAALSSQLIDGLAGDAVRNDARGCDLPFWWRDVDDCDNLTVTSASIADVPAHSPSAGPHRIIYDEGDPVARDLAQRIVALASGKSPPRSRAPAATRPESPPTALTPTRWRGAFAGETTSRTLSLSPAGPPTRASKRASCCGGHRGCRPLERHSPTR
jgi:hypothetical protein